jgi:hypothetical protein
MSTTNSLTPPKSGGVNLKKKKHSTLKDVLSTNEVIAPLVILWGYKGVYIQEVGGIRKAREVHIKNIVSFERWKYFSNKPEMYEWWDSFGDVEWKHKFLQCAKELIENKRKKFIVLP